MQPKQPTVGPIVARALAVPFGIIQTILYYVRSPQRLSRRSRWIRPLLFTLVCAFGTVSLLYPIGGDEPARIRLPGGLKLGRETEGSGDGSAVSLNLRYESDGIARGWKEAQNSAQVASGWGKKKSPAATHPIEALIQNGQRHWKQLLASQSRTLPKAVLEYKRRYGRPPPKGFAEWWQFCKRNNVKIVDDYDQINSDIAPFFALSPATFKKRVQDVQDTEHSYRVHLNPSSRSSVSGERAKEHRAPRLLSLLEPIAQYLPDPLVMTVSDHDLGSWILGDDLRVAAMRTIARGKYFTNGVLNAYEKTFRNEYSGLTAACPKDSPAWIRTVGAYNPDDDEPDKEMTFIHNHNATFDFCYSPDLIKQHGALSFQVERDTMLRPIFQLSKFSRNPEFLITPLDAYENATDHAKQADSLTWDQKTENKLLWRGTTTGDSYSKRKGYDWHKSHRPRLVLMANAKKGERDVWVQKNGVWKKQRYPLAELNEKWMDVAITNDPHQCNKEDGTCDEMARELTKKDRLNHEAAAKYKYVMDVDGNGWSSRFHRLLSSESLIFKATIYPEWMSQWLTPWVHYIPVQQDYSDLYDIMAFFMGSPEDPSTGHDKLARQIAEQGKYFAENFWRWEDMQAYMLRLLLEYNRLMATDREAASYSK